MQRIYPVACVLELPLARHCLSVSLCRRKKSLEEVLLNTRCIVIGYHLCRFEINIGEVFTASKKRGEHGNVFKVVNHRGQLGHLQSELVDPLRRVLMGVPSYQLTTNFSANCQLTTNFS